MKIRKSVTAAKVNANKKNAKRSTGPRSPQGMMFSSKNAIRHGVLTRDLLLPGPLSGEWDADLERLRTELVADCGAVGSSELAQVGIVLSSVWRLRRLYRAEAGEITMLLVQCNPTTEITACAHSRQFQQANADLAKLEKVEEEIKLHASVSADSLDWIRRLPYGEPVNAFAKGVELIQVAEGEERGNRGPQTPPAAEETKTTWASRATTSEKDDSAA
jgi:hypothetical protein